MHEKEVVFKLGELFCGPGGLALGAKKAIVRSLENKTTYRIKHVWATDYHQESCQTYAQNIKGAKIICSDVRNLMKDEKFISVLDEIDAFAYGFPCNDFSIVGESKGMGGEFGGLYKYGVKILSTFKPKFFLAENVGGLTSANEGKAFHQILNDLKNAGNGYELTVHKYRFEEYGVPQKRHRIIIVGIDKKIGLKFKVPAPTTKNKHISVKEVLEDNPIPSDAPNHEITKQSAIVVERLKYIKPGENIWQTELPEHLQLNVKGAKMSQIYRRLHPNQPSYTITGSGGGGTHGYHYKELRALTNRERARIQTFPDDFVFVGKKESVRRQIGMAVSPLMAQILFESILKTFACIDYESVEPNLQFNKI
ncbi:DNA-cytosine methyltransferase [Hydrogenimonas sp.]|nr:DNA-cytosine methyltransferase [Hydrogenimonas sp.]